MNSRCLLSDLSVIGLKHALNVPVNQNIGHVSVAGDATLQSADLKVNNCTSLLPTGLDVSLNRFSFCLIVGSSHGSSPGNSQNTSPANNPNPHGQR